ncbi:hypothetical protein KF840_09945 [bacterium]|nr:hypothetical protein [bacterium]
MRLSLVHHQPHTNRVSVRVWRLASGGPQWLYTYAGTIDQGVLGSVMQTIRRLTEAVPGEWIVDVLIVGIDHGLLRAIQDDLHALRDKGVQPCLRHARRRGAWMRRPASPAGAPPLLH